MISCNSIEPEKKTPTVSSPATSTPEITDSITKAPFLSETGRFSIQFPDEPILDEHMTSTEIGQIRLYQYIYSKDNTNAWLVSYSDYPEKMIKMGNKAQLLKGIKHRVLQGLNARASAEKKIKVQNKYQGLSFVAKSRNKKLDILYRIFLVENRVYQISMYSSVGPFTTKDSTDFIGSFELLSEN
jgi:hypothetical protein